MEDKYNIKEAVFNLRNYFFPDIPKKYDARRITTEINDHFKIFDKNADEVDYNSVGPCPLCGSSVDEWDVTNIA